MKKPAVWLGVLFFALVAGYLVYSSFHTARFRCQVCITFRGRTDCRTASAETRDGAIRTAVDNACAQLAAGVDESTQCSSTPPASVRWLE